MSEIISKYIKEVLSIIIPEILNSDYNYHIKSTKDSNYELNKLELEVPPLYLRDKSSNFYSDENQSLIHFTSLKVLYSIINEGFFRLYPLIGTNDVREVNRVSERFNLNEKQIIEFKQNMYFASFCPESVINSKDELLFWRLYGSNGKGVALKLKLKNYDPKKTDDWHLGKVRYSKPKNIESFNKAHNKFIVENQIQLLDIQSIINTYSCLHKSLSYRHEEEIRLLFLDPNKSHKGINHLPEFGVDFKDKLILYKKMNIGKVSNKPYFELNEVIFGPNFKKENFGKLKGDLLSAIWKTEFPERFNITISKIDEELK